jgi:hypothetical protein
MSLDSIFQNLFKIPSGGLAGKSLKWVPQTYAPKCKIHLLFCNANVIGKVGAFDQGPGKIRWFYQVDLSRQGVWIGPYQTAAAAKLDCENDVRENHMR